MRDYLLFRLGTVEFAVPHDAVAAILPAPAILPLPPAPNGISGILPHTATPRYVLDLRLKFALPPSAPTPTAIALRAFPVALLADAILDSARIPDQSIRPVRPHPKHLYRNYTSGVWRGRSRPCFLLDLHSLCGPDGAALTQSPEADLSAPHSAPRLL